MTLSHAVVPNQHGFNAPLFVQWLPNLLRWLVLWLIVCLAVLPVLLLLVNTAVPWFVVGLLLLADAGLVWLLPRPQSTRVIALVMVGLVIVAVVAVFASQRFAATPLIVDATGQAAANSIAVMEQVTLGGTEQWITIRGKNVDSPVLLYLGIGGPGAVGFPATRLALAPLEDHFVVVNWDQPGTGKSYGATPIAALTVDRVVEDAHELTEQMRARFGEEKIYVLGLSWGTIVGIKLVQQYPELFHAYVGNGQMVNTTENDQFGYALALDLTRQQGELAAANRLERYGPPPYSGKGMAMKYADYNNVLFRHMQSPTLDLVLLLVPQFAREYGLIDRVNFARGLVDSFPVLYPQLRDLDFTQQAAELEVPVYFLVGRDDVNAVAALVERYFGVLDAPNKELIWLEGGHGATPEQFEDVLVNRVLTEVAGGAD